MHKLMLIAALALPVSSSAQLTIGTASLAVKGGTNITTDGLTLQPSTDMTISNESIVRSTTPVMGITGNASIARVYNFSTPLAFSGTVSFHYEDNELGNNTEAALHLTYSATNPALSWTTSTAGNVNATSNIVTQTFSGIVLGRITTTSSTSPLPVKLLAFNGSADGGANRLDWSTATESGILDYVVERSDNGSFFEAIGKVSAKGEHETYQFYDRKPQGSLNYYRLRIEEITGENYNSNTILIRNTVLNGGVIIEPVPAGNYIFVTNDDAILKNTAATIVNMQGIPMVRFVVSASCKIDVSRWPAGIYIMKLENGTALRLLKQ